jgi:hypothetical protein
MQHAKNRRLPLSSIGGDQFHADDFGHAGEFLQGRRAIGIFRNLSLRESKPEADKIAERPRRARLEAHNPELLVVSVTQRR